MHPLVTVVIPAFDAAKTIARALDSVIAQTYPAIETIVVDDCSRDSTAQVVEGYARHGVRVVRLPRNSGVSQAMNEGIAIARGAYIAFLDADDEWHPNKLRKQIDALERNPAASFAACAYALIKSTGEPAGLHGFPPKGFSGLEPWRYLLFKNFVAKPCVVARASSLRMTGPFDVTLRVAEDQDMWIRLAEVGALEFIPEVLVNIYSTPNSLMKVYAGREAEFVLPMISRRVQARRHLLSESEVKRILGERYASVGRDLCHSGDYLRGSAYVLRGVAVGANIRDNLWFVFIASPLVKTSRTILARLKREARRIVSLAARAP